MNAPLPLSKRRCAVYCRVSSDERLDQSFNSIDAQKESGHAFIRSQAHEGWIAVTDNYDDGGFSGGTMERPALKRLLKDIELGKIDIVVVYKIDRLSRSLADFARMVEVFDRCNVSFSAVTQQINSATSMGRLMLNVLLSFAQFEREVTGERIRDKIAASKAKGMWMGGVPPLGYDVRDRRLVINPEEAALVRDIFQRYAEERSAARLLRELNLEGRTTKSWVSRNGKQHAGRPMTQKFLHDLLSNRVYLGEVTHKGQSFPGQHEAIVTESLWDAAQAVRSRRQQRPPDYVAEHPALLAGLLYAPDGQRMRHTFTRRRGRMYRYYVPTLHKRQHAGATLNPDQPNIGPMPAADLELAVLEQIYRMLQAPELLIAIWTSCLQHATGHDLEEGHVIVQMRDIAAVWNQLFPLEQQRIARLLIDRVQLHDQGLDIHWREDGWRGLSPDVHAHPLVDEYREAC